MTYIQRKYFYDNHILLTVRDSVFSKIAGERMKRLIMCVWGGGGRGGELENGDAFELASSSTMSLKIARNNYSGEVSRQVEYLPF